jgi:hypothetical protein
MNDIHGLIFILCLEGFTKNLLLTHWHTLMDVRFPVVWVALVHFMAVSQDEIQKTVHLMDKICMV